MIAEPSFNDTTSESASETEIAIPDVRSWLDRPLLAALNWEKTLYVLFVAIAFVTRLWDMGARVMSHDESLHTYFSYLLAQGKGFQHTPLMHGPFLFHITALSYFLFGDNDWTSRLPTALFGIALVAIPYFFRRYIGRGGALAAAFALLISPSIWYHARYIRQEEFILVWTILTALLTWRYIETKKFGYLVGLAVVLGFHGADKSTSFLTVAMFVIFLSAVTLWQLYAKRSDVKDPLRLVGFAAVLGVVIVALSVLMEVAGRGIAGMFGLNAATIGANPVALSLDGGTLKFMVVMVLLGGIAAIAIAMLLKQLFGTWLADTIDTVPALGPIITMIVTTLFMASPALLLILNPIWKRVQGAPLIDVALLGEMSNLKSNGDVVVVMFSLAFALIAVSVALGLAWNWRRWLAIVGPFLGVTVPLFTTLFTNAAGIGSGFVGQLGYWMAQQGVARGSQPPYYYFIIVPIYEYGVLIGALCASAYIGYRVIRNWPFSRNSAKRVSADGGVELQHPSANQWFVGFMVWWMVATWIIYSAAGEKMPWLTVHFALPMSLLTGWFIGKVVGGLRLAGDEPLSGAMWWKRASAVAGLSVLAVVLAVRALSLIGGLGSEDGYSGFAFFGNFAVTIATLAAVVYTMRIVAPQAALRGILLASFVGLSVLTVRTAVMVTYINYDYAKEFLFYAHGAPGTKIALAQLNELSDRLGGNNPLKVGYTQEMSWPMSWYMREFPNNRFFGAELPDDFGDFQAILASKNDAKYNEWQAKMVDSYTAFDYTMVWWPMQDYWELDKSAEASSYRASGWDRIKYVITNPKARAAVWEIVFNRNYAPYSSVFNKTSLTPETWDPRHAFTLFIRNDVAQQIWSYRVGDGSAAGARPPAPAAKVQSPTGIKIGPDGARFVIDHKSNRVFELSADNLVVNSFGGFGSGTGKFNDAWGLAIDASGSIFVADTFNHRIQKFDRNGQFLFQWGTPGASTEPGSGTSTQFFGPRDILIDKGGNLLVTDTGNKRVQVFDPSGNFITQFGTSGAGDGQFSEPVGLAQDDAGNTYVADTWNKRIQVFDTSYKFVRSFPVESWATMNEGDLTGTDHKPYLVMAGNTLLVSSPKTNQVLAFSTDGKPLPPPELALNPGDQPTGLTVAGSTLYVTNAANGQVLTAALK